jgi:hypothetical protein
MPPHSCPTSATSLAWETRSLCPIWTTMFFGNSQPQHRDCQNVRRSAMTPGRVPRLPATHPESHVTKQPESTPILRETTDIRPLTITRSRPPPPPSSTTQRTCRHKPQHRHNAFLTPYPRCQQPEPPILSNATHSHHKRQRQT